VPAAAGANATFSVIIGWASELCRGDAAALNPVPMTVTLEIVTFEFPLFVSAALNELLLPTFTLPKLMFVGSHKQESWGHAVPLREMPAENQERLLTTEMDPPAAPAAVGEKTALNVTLVPAQWSAARSDP